MASVSRLSYQRLQTEEVQQESILEREVKKARAWLKFRALAGRRRPRPRLRIRGLRRFVRKRSRFLTRFRFSWRKALKRLKKGQSHMNDLFGGNYLLMQLNPTPFTCRQKQGLHAQPSKYSVARFA